MKPVLKKIVLILIEIGPVIFDRIKARWKTIFNAQPFLILGDKGTGKTALRYYLQHDRPQEKDGDEWVAPNPTVGKEKHKTKFDVDKGKRIVVKVDVGGDPMFRETWKEVIEEFHPKGIIYMIDGRHTGEEIQARIKELFEDCLAHCDISKGLPHTVHVFINFADIWAKNEAERRLRCREMSQLCDQRGVDCPGHEHLQLDVWATSLDPKAESWPLTERALRRFGDDLTSPGRAHG